MKRTMRAISGVACALSATWCAAAGSGSADARLQAIYSAEWTWREQQLPDTEDARAPIQDHLPRMDPATQLERLHHWEDIEQQLDGIPRAELSSGEQLNYDIYYPQIETLIAQQRFREYEMPANADTTFWTNIGYTARRTFRSLEDYRAWIAQMRDIPRYFREQTGEMRAGLKRGFTPPKITMTGRDASITNVIDAMPEASLLFEPFKEMPGIAGPDQAKLRREAVEVIRDAVQPAYRELLAFMRTEYLPNLRDTLGAYDLPEGKAYYRAKIQEFVTLDEEPAQIHAFGEAEVRRLHEAMLRTLKETGFGGDFTAFLKFLRTDPQFTAKSPVDLLMHAAYIAKRFDGKADQYFGHLPRMRFAIKPVPDDLAPFYTAGRGGPGLYLLNTYDLPQRPMYNLTALTLHESAPGHAFQLPLALEHKDQPQFRQHTYISAYGEGWGLYCETLGEEMGMYETPYERFGMLNYQAWRAARLVIDTGLHAQGWSRARAIAYLHDNTALADHEIETEIDRYISWPAQALSYYMGEAEILKLRAQAQKALGSRFNIRAFHDTILELGSVPLPVLDARIARFIAEGGRGPYPDEE